MLFKLPSRSLSLSFEEEDARSPGTREVAALVADKDRTRDTSYPPCATATAAAADDDDDVFFVAVVAAVEEVGGIDEKSLSRSWSRPVHA